MTAEIDFATSVDLGLLWLHWKINWPVTEDRPVPE